MLNYDNIQVIETASIGSNIAPIHNSVLFAAEKSGVALSEMIFFDNEWGEFIRLPNTNLNFFLNDFLRNLIHILCTI